MRRQSCFIYWPALTNPFELALIWLDKSVMENAMISFCGSDHTPFGILLDMFEHMFERQSAYSDSGLITQKFYCSWMSLQMINARICLALCLEWTITRSGIMIFWIFLGLLLGVSVYGSDLVDGLLFKCFLHIHGQELKCQAMLSLWSWLILFGRNIYCWAGNGGNGWIKDIGLMGTMWQISLFFSWQQNLCLLFQCSWNYPWFMHVFIG